MLDSLMAGMTGGAPSFKSSSSAESAFRGENSLGFDNSGFTVATGGSSATGGAVNWLVIAGLAFAVLLIVKKLK